jgi:ribosome recycling factor
MGFMIFQQLKKKMVKKIKIFRRDLKLLWKTPIEYLYSFTYPDNKYVQIQPYDPKVTEIGQQLVNKI